MFNVKKNIFVNSIGDVLRCKRASFTTQKVPFYNAKGRLLLSVLQPIDYLKITKPKKK